MAATTAFGSRGEDSLHFCAFGDTGSGGEQQKVVAEGLAQFAAKSAHDKPVSFVVMLGDNFYEDGVKSVNDPQWTDKFENMYDSNRLGMPFFVVLGNHDWHKGLPDVEIDYARAHPASRWKMDAHYYKRQFWAGAMATNEPPLLDLFAIDTEAFSDDVKTVLDYPDKQLGAKQLAWLEQQLQESHATWKIVVAHHPLYSNGAHAHEAQLAKLKKILGPLFQKYKVDAFITGHDHDLERNEIPDKATLFLISGTGGKLRPQVYHDWKPFFASKPGFLSVELTPMEMSGQFLDAEGRVLDVFQRKPNSAATK